MMNYQLNDLRFVETLRKWRILDFYSLKEISGYIFSDSAFYKKIKRLERCKIIKTFQEFNRGRKYAYLTKKGKDLLGSDENYDCVADARQPPNSGQFLT